MKKIATPTIKLLGLLALTIFAGGCATAVSPYNISADNISSLRGIESSTSIKVNTFTAEDPGRNSVLVRLAGPVKTPNGESFEDYIHDALVDELVMAELYSKDAPRTLDGHLEGD